MERKVAVGINTWCSSGGRGKLFLLAAQGLIALIHRVYVNTHGVVTIDSWVFRHRIGLVEIELVVDKCGADWFESDWSIRSYQKRNYAGASCRPSIALRVDCNIR